MEQNQQVQFHELNVPNVQIAQENNEFWVLLGNYKLHEKPFKSLKNAKSAWFYKDWEILSNFIVLISKFTYLNENESNKQTEENTESN